MPYVMGQLRRCVDYVLTHPTVPYRYPFSSHQIIVNKLAAKLEGTEALPAIQQVK